VLRLSFGGPESSESRDVTGSDCAEEVESDDWTARRRGAMVAELLGSIGALAAAAALLPDGDELLAEVLGEVLGTLSELDPALRNLGRSGSSSLLLEELLEELVEVSSDEPARRSLGRLGSSLEELEVLSSDEEALRSWGRSLSDREFEALVEEGLVIGRMGSSVACDAAACSSRVPAFTIDMFLAL
jgi:hypothetical protein